MKTVYSKGKAETMTPTDPNGKAWQINTWKNDRGFVVCSAVQGTLGDGIFSYDLFGGKRLALANEQGIATEKRIQSVHERGLAEFERIMAEEAKTKGPVYPIQVGQIIFSEGLGESRARVIHKVVRPGKYESVYLDGSGFETDEHLKPITEKHGIGAYYREDERLAEDEVKALVTMATETVTRKHKEEREKEEQEQQDRADKIAKGAQIITAIPAGAVAIIVGRLEENTSDPYSDYFASRTVKTVYLAFSDSKRDDFNEMRQAAGLCEETAHLKTAGPDAEHREKYSMGHGYYLSTGGRYSGWQVSKDRIGDYTSLENLQIAAAEGRYFCDKAPLTTVDTNFYGQSVTVPSCRMRINQEKSGIELYFVGKPASTILDDLKRNGWRWARFNKCWYARDTERARAFASKYTGQSTQSQDGALVEAQERAGQEAFAHEVEGD